MSRSRRVAIESGGGNVPGFSAPAYQPFNANGYTKITLATPLDLGMPAKVTSVTVWSEGVISLGDPNAAQIAFMHDHYASASHSDISGFPGDSISVGFQDTPPSSITLQSGPDGDFYVTWGDPYNTSGTGSQFSEVAFDGTGFTEDAGFYDGSDFNPDHPSGTPYNSDHTVSYTLEHAHYDESQDHQNSTSFYTVVGTSAGEAITGGAYAEIIAGKGGADTLTGGGGADWFRYDAASDSTAAAPDRITDFQSGSEKIDARALGADGVMISQSGGLYAVDIPTASGTLHVTSNNPVAFADLLLTDSGASSTFTGTAGADVLYGLGGNDNLSGRGGADLMVGGTGNDNYRVDDPGDRVVEAPGEGVDLVYAAISYTLPDNVENGTVNGTGAINLTGNALDNILTGGSGDNILDGGAGTNDTASFASATGAVVASLATHQATGFGSDTLNNIENLTGSAYADTLTGDGNANVLNGGAGNDRLDGGAGSDTASYVGATGAITVSLAVAAAQNTGGAGTDTLVSIENLIGSGYADHLTGSSVANTIEGGLGNDVLDGGGGTDTVTYAHATAAVTVNLALTSAQNTIAAGSDTLTNFENVTGSDYNDTLSGNSADNYLAGGLGDDLIAGGLGNDTISGSIGSDTATYANAATGITASLTSNTATGEGNDVFKSIENLIGSSHADHLTGSNIANVIEGGAGDDVLDGVGTGDGDAASYAHATAAVTVNLALTTAQNTGGAGTDTLANFENLLGSGYGDTLTGNAQDNHLAGGAGNDTLDGGAGNDVLDGGAGTDVASFASAIAGVTASLAAGHASGFGEDMLVGIESLTGSGFNDVLSGDGGNNYLAGGSGDDILHGGAGNDTLSGSFGSDTASFAGDANAVTASIANGTATGEGNDILRSIENLVGSDQPDTLTGDVNNNVINPGGGYGGDTIDGGGGTNTISFAGDPTVTVHLEQSYASYGSYGLGYDPISLTSIQNIIGSSGSDFLEGDSGNNDFHGGAGGRDEFYGDAGSDHFYFDTPLSDSNTDSIDDFTHGTDLMYLDRAIFTAISANGSLDPAAFETGTAATDASVHILYDPASGALQYDADGNGSAAPVAVAYLSANLPITASDFFAYL